MRPAVLALMLLAILPGCAEVQAQESPAAGPDLTGKMILESAAGCRFDPLTNHSLEGLLMRSNWEPFTMISAPRVFVGDLELAPEIEREEGAGVVADTSRVIHRSRAQFPEGTRWHGLTPSALHFFYAHNPRTDHYQERGIIFANSPDEVHAALKAMGQEVPIAPGWLELTEFGPFYDQFCGSSISINPHDEGAALICGYGC